ncbi:MAG: PEP-CTERM sorting domain-containing protein, partial [Verrucomicrobiales bacterium]|nr:PEP-CTERM sorting domain-containing protein [Verrucomicrobiales bacterium]
MVGVGVIATPSARAQYNYALNYQTNIINVVSNWAGNGRYVVGSNTFGNALIINPSGVLSNGTGYIGLEFGGSNNIAIVNGGVWSNRSTLYVGWLGAGNQLIVSNGGAVVNGDGLLGYNSSISNNVAVVTGTGSVWSNRNYLNVGVSGAGNQLIVSNGGAVVNSDGYLGNTSRSSSNVATVGGNNARWVNSRDLIVGLSGDTNTLNIATGGSVIASNAFVGFFSAADGNRINVTGGNLYVTNAPGTGTLDIRRGTLTFDGGNIVVDRLLLTNGNNSRITFNSGTLISGGTSVSNFQNFVIGNTGSAATFIANGGTHRFTNDLYVGNSGFGNRLVVSNGASVLNSAGYLGYNSSSSNNVAEITGTGSVWSNQNNLYVGYDGAGNQLIVSNGGAVVNSDGYLGYYSSNNVATVGGNNARWVNSRDLYVGRSGDTNTLNIATGGSVIASNAYVGLNAGADGNRINVTGGNLYVTNAPGTGTLDIRRGTLTFDGGLVQVDRLVLSNGSASVFNFQAGHLITGSTLVTNGAVFNIGNGLNAATMSLGAGTHAFSNGVQVTGNSQLRVVGNTATITGPGLFNQSGGVVTTSHAGLVVRGIVTNQGTFTMLNSVGTFNGSVVNAGAWIIDPTTNVFNDAFIVTESGYVSAGAGDVFIFTNNATTAGSFLNRSTNSAAFNTADAKFLFNATLAVTQHFYAAGLNRESLAPSYSPTSTVTGSWSAVTFTNFSLGTLEISNFSTVRVWDAFSGLGGEFGANDGLKAALYVDNLLLGLNSHLIISDNVELYFLNSNVWSSANYTLLGSGELHQFFSTDLAMVPEPSTLLLLMAGAAAI